ncbi:hypothetical protein L208DRAFT_1462693 [Tricholoma matsutake]|nr:hypothetical protein L208DRAFT_1462693 [Tricholoma matsutake 945]
MSLSGPPSTTAQLIYSIKPADGARAFRSINADSKTGQLATNLTRLHKDVVIENLRGKEDSFTLDTAGFQLWNRPSKHKAFTDDAEVEREYYPESIEFIKEVTGASRVVLFDHTIRRRRAGEIDDAPDRRQPVANAHVDQTTVSAIARVHRHLPAEDVPELLKRRFQLINLWRPISLPAIDWPLAFCDYKSVDPENDLFPVSLVYPDREGETMGVDYNPNQKWKYFHGMTPDEFVLIKCFDSIQDGSVAVFTPHTAFKDPLTPAGTPPRESIEVRALVFYD